VGTLSEVGLSLGHKGWLAGVWRCRLWGSALDAPGGMGSSCTQYLWEKKCAQGVRMNENEEGQEASGPNSAYSLMT
jgi:hypothetical protein